MGLSVIFFYISLLIIKYMSSICLLSLYFFLNLLKVLSISYNAEAYCWNLLLLVPLSQSRSLQIFRLESREIHDLPRRKIKNSRASGCPKGTNDPVALHNKFGALEDMDFALSPSSTRVLSHSPKKQNGRISAIKHTKQAWIVLHFSNGTVEDLR